MSRTSIGFVIAPLCGSAVPVLSHVLLFPLFNTPDTDYWSGALKTFGGVYLFVVAMNYFVTFFFAVPIFIFLRRVERIGLIMMLGVGVFLGGVTALLPFFMIPFERWGAASPETLRHVGGVAYYGISSGLATAFAFWMIAIRNHEADL